MTAADQMLEVRGLRKRFGSLAAVDDVSFSVRRGGITALIGPNGAGKSVTFSLVTGHSRADAGTVVFDGEDVTGLPPHVLARRGLARSFQTAKVFSSMTVRETIMTAALIKEGRGAAFARADAVMEELGLTGTAAKRAGELSLPDRQMVELGKCLAIQPKMVMLDEIMGGLNQSETDLPIAAIRRLAERGITFLLVEHVMPIVMSLTEQIMVLDFGKLIAAGTPAEITANPDVQRSYLGGAA